MERADHVTLMATSSDRAATVCFGPTGQVFQPTLATDNPTDPCADEPSLASMDVSSAETPPLVSSLPISTGALTADLPFPAGELVTVSAFVALRGSQVIGQAIGSATGTRTATDGYSELALSLAKTLVADPACTGVTYGSTPAGVTPTPCGTAGAACFETTDVATPAGEHDPRVSCPSSSGAAFIVSGAASSCSIAWRHVQTGDGCTQYAVQLSFYVCADGSVPDGQAQGAGSSCVRTTACTPPSVTVIGASPRTSSSSLDIGACVPPSIFPFAFTIPTATSNAILSVDLAVAPAATIAELPTCDVEVDVLADVTEQAVGCNK